MSGVIAVGVDGSEGSKQALRRAAAPAAGRHPAVTVCDLPTRGLLDASAGADLIVVGARGLGGFEGSAPRLGQPAGGQPRALPGGDRAAR